MTGVFFDPPRNDEAWREMIYDGNIIILSPTPEMLALVEHTRGHDRGCVRPARSSARS